jgi:hypothetical protein
MQVCYDGELFHRVLTLPGAPPEARARAVLALTRADCIDPDLVPVARASVDAERAQLLDQVKDDDSSAMMRSRLHARRAGVWASLAFGRDRRRESTGAEAERARAELLAVDRDDLGDDRRSEFLDAVLRVAAVRWSGAQAAPQPGPVTLTASPGEPGETCVALEDSHGARTRVFVRRCTYGIVRMASLQVVPRAQALVPRCSRSRVGGSSGYFTKRPEAGRSMCSRPGSKAPRKATWTMRVTCPARGAC